jgi:hypothetical protein
MADWTVVGEYATRFEAEIARTRLESADIPAGIFSHEGGIFGAGFQGAVPGGVEIRVPTERVDEARAVLDIDDEPSDQRE